MMVAPGQTRVRLEPTFDPAQPIVDAHHHLYDRAGVRYLADEYSADLRSGHNVRATIFVQARAFYRTQGPEALRPVGETEFAASVAEQSVKAGGPRLCAGIVGYADLMSGDAVRPVLEAHLAAGKGRFRGIRHILAWDADASLLNPAYPTSEDMMSTAAFQAGFAHLVKLGLTFDAWLLFPQIPRLVTLARRFPEVGIVLNHCGGVLGVGSYANKRAEVFATWREAMGELSACSNVSVKVGGLGMAISGFNFDRRERSPSSVDLVNAWRPWVQSCIDLFGPRRCMFESNFPADRPSHGYGVGWNAMKRLSADLSVTERNAVFHETATRFYRLES